MSKKEKRLAMYPEFFVAPMREELTRLGIKELKSAAEVDAALTAPGTTMKRSCASCLVRAFICPW